MLNHGVGYMPSAWVIGPLGKCERSFANLGVGMVLGLDLVKHCWAQICSFVSSALSVDTGVLRRSYEVYSSECRS